MPGQLRAAEFVLPGHPDKVCDAIADALVQEAARRERRALVGVEVAVHRAAVFVTGRIACADAETIDIAGIVRGICASAGYGRKSPPAPEDLQIHEDVCVGPLADGESDFRSVSDDQSMVRVRVPPAWRKLPAARALARRMSGKSPARSRVGHNAGTGSGLGFSSGLLPRVTLLMTCATMLTTLSIPWMAPQLVWRVFPVVLTFEGEYVVKDVVIASSALVLATTLRGGFAAAEQRTLATLILPVPLTWRRWYGHHSGRLRTWAARHSPSVLRIAFECSRAWL
jgi:S-adenosylmethionine synthetase, N-terminal domain